MIEPANPPLPAPLPRKINVGCGYDRREGYLNVDLHAVHKPDLVADVTALPMLPSASFDEILAQDVLEHFERAKTAPALQEWARLLAPGGILHVRVPSLFGMFELLAQPRNGEPANAEEVIHLMYGTQAYTGDYHLAGFTAKTLDEHLRRAGLLVCEASILHGWLFDVRARKVERLASDIEFLHSAYFSILGRPADADGVDTFGSLLASGGMSRDAVERTLRNSEEARFLASNPAYLLPHAARLGLPTRAPLKRRLRSIASALRNRLRSG
ncbi:MAG TPA: methyltransferase domain-containing protein [Dokdonella sp.]|nr:methyltransferase domain-containing protein [Dokdonella sp.]